MFLHQGPPKVEEEEEKKEGEEEGKEEGEGEGEGEEVGEEEREEEGEVADLDILLRREREKEKKRKEGPQVGVTYLSSNCTQMYPQDLSRRHSTSKLISSSRCQHLYSLFPFLSHHLTGRGGGGTGDKQ